MPVIYTCPKCKDSFTRPKPYDNRPYKTPSRVECGKCKVKMVMTTPERVTP